MPTEEDVPPPRRATLGDVLTFGVPFDRIILHPTPGTATASDVARIVDHEDRLCELVDGTLVERAPGWAESLLVVDLIGHLDGPAREGRRGFLVGPKAPVQLRPGLVRAPDLAYYLRKNLPGGRLPRDSVAALVPDLVVEIWRPGNTPAEMKRKAGDFRAAGTRLVWLVEPRRRRVRVLEPGGRQAILGADDTLDGDPVLPGFRLRVGDLLDLGQFGQFGRTSDRPEAAKGTIDLQPGGDWPDPWHPIDQDSGNFRTSGPRRHGP